MPHRSNHPGSEPLAKGKPGPTRRHRLKRRHWGVVGALLLIPALLIAYKLSGLPGSDATAAALSLEHLSRSMQGRAHHLLFAPFGALVVVMFRLTLGLRVLGPFRSLLLALAFQATGIAMGVTFFTLVICVVVFLRPRIKGTRIPYFGRATLSLASVATVLAGAMLLGLAMGLPSIERLAYFPIVVLTLAGDAFAVALRREGRKSATWRAGVTALAAIVITLLGSIAAIQDALVRFPELILCCPALIMVVSDRLALRLLQHLNPPPKKKKKSKKAKTSESAPMAAAPVAAESAQLNARLGEVNPLQTV